MGSPPTLDPIPTRPLATTQEQYRDSQHDRTELLAHLQTPAAFGGHEFGDWPEEQIAGGFGGDLDARHRHDHIRLAHEFGHSHPDLQRDAVRDAERAFDQLNPDYRSSGSPARTTEPPTPSRPPALSPPEPGTAWSGSALNANHQYEQGAPEHGSG